MQTFLIFCNFTSLIFYDKFHLMYLQVRKVVLNDLHDMLAFKEPK